MKYFFAILAGLAMSVLFSVPSVQGEPNQVEQCMEDCLEPAIKSGDPAAIEAAINSCVRQCEPGPRTLGSSNSESLGQNRDDNIQCIINCASKKRQCLVTVKDPRKCDIHFKNCRRSCYR